MVGNIWDRLVKALMSALSTEPAPRRGLFTRAENTDVSLLD